MGKGLTTGLLLFHSFYQKSNCVNSAGCQTAALKYDAVTQILSTP